MHLTLTHFAALRCKPALYTPVGTKFDHQKRIALGFLASLDCIKVYRTAFSFRNDSNLFVSGEVLPAGRGKEHKGWKPLYYRHFAGKRGEKNKKVTVGRETSPGWCWVSLRMFCSPLRKRTDARVTLCALCAIGCSRAELGQSPTALASWAVRSKAGNVKTKQSFFIYCSTSKFQSHLFVLNTQYNSNFLEVFKGNSMEKGNHMIRIWFAHGLAANWLLQLCFPYEYVSLVPYEWWKIILDPLECTDCAYELPDSKKCLLFGETFICASSEVVLCNASIACGAIAQSSPQTVPECVCVCFFFWGAWYQWHLFTNMIVSSCLLTVVSNRTSKKLLPLEVGTPIFHAFAIALRVLAPDAALCWRLKCRAPCWIRNSCSTFQPRLQKADASDGMNFG